MAIEIRTTTAFDQDVKQCKKRHRELSLLWDAVDTIVQQDVNRLRTFYKDHALTGQWKGYRELHIQADWLLIYKFTDGYVTLLLTRTGSHDALFSVRKQDVRRYQ